MPELPDVEAYVVALRRQLSESTLQWIRIHHPFLLRSVDVPAQECEGLSVAGVTRLGKRIVISLEREIHLVIHLMIAGRFRWKEGHSAPPPRRGAKSNILAEFGFAAGVLTFTEAGSKRRASLHVVRGNEGLAALNPGGVEILNPTIDLASFCRLLRMENHTIKRSLTDPRLFSGIGNSFSDEILFAGKLSPFAMTQSLSDEELSRLHSATIETLRYWRDGLVADAQVRFPGKVTAFRPDMHVHGKYNTPCSVCSTPVQRIRYAENECNYCPTCQTGGKVYADRALSRLLKDDWPRTVEELEKLKRPPGNGSRPSDE